MTGEFRVGIIGGTHLLETGLLEEGEAREITTRWGAAEVDTGLLAGIRIAAIHRHGRKKNRPPHAINHAANLAALQSMGVARVISMGSVGCLREEVDLPSLIVPHDYIDLFGTSTIFHDALTHVTPGFDEGVRRALLDAAQAVAGGRLIDHGVYFQTRGPRLETRAEIAMIRAVADCVGMSIGSEATIARELGLSYAAVCTMDNYAHGIRGHRPEYADIVRRAGENARSCIDVVRGAIRGMS
ncbi:MAG: 6-oxopurine nucleoside phosphorylase [Planctomycetes bacterium]|nr:6-oxopurine nucleoside phosphorylase [Planctomycetota bacterium]